VLPLKDMLAASLSRDPFNRPARRGYFPHAPATSCLDTRISRKPPASNTFRAPVRRNTSGNAKSSVAGGRPKSLSVRRREDQHLLELGNCHRAAPQFRGRPFCRPAILFCALLSGCSHLVKSPIRQERSFIRPLINRRRIGKANGCRSF
jgi:hypothetical protein